MKKLFAIIAFLVFIPSMAAAGMLIGGGVESGGASCSLLSDTFTGSDGTDITSAGWATDGTDPGDLMELDDSLGGSTLLIDHNGNAVAYNVYRTFTQQTSGTFTVSFDYRTSSIGSGEQAMLVLMSEGAYVWASTSAVHIRQYVDDIEYYSSGWVKLCTSCVSTGTWYTYRIDLDMDANTFDFYIDGSPVASDKSFSYNTDPNRIYFFKATSGNFFGDTWIGDLCIE